MASIHLQGTLVDTLGEIDVGAIMTWTHLTATGETIPTTKVDLIIPPNGFYSIDVEYGQIRIDYTTRFTERFIATVIVNQDSTATTIPELLNAAVPVTDPVILEMQSILADAVAAADTSEAFADQLTTFDLIGSVAVFAPDTNFRTKGYLTSGDGGAGHWVQNGVTAQPVSQSPAQLGDALLNDGNGNQWALVMNKQLFLPKVGLKTGQDNYLIFKIAQNVINNTVSFISVAFPPGDFYAVADSEYIIDVTSANNFSIIGNQTNLRLLSGLGSILRIQFSTDWSVSGVSFFLNQSIASGFHGVAITDCQRFTLEKGSINNCGGYGIGLQGDSTASYENCTIQNMKIIRAGSDGVDFKNNEGTNRAIILDNLYVEDPGWFNELKPGLDIRGPATVSNIHVVFRDNVNFNMVGIRTRQTGSGLIGAEKSTITNVIVDDLTTGMSNVGVALVESNVVHSNMTVTGCLSQGFQIADDSTNLQLMNCLAIGCGTGFFNSGQNSKLLYCEAIDSVSEGFRSSGTTASSYAFCESIGAGTFGFRAAAATGIDLAYCKSSGSGSNDYSVGATARAFMCDGFTGNSTLQTTDNDYVKFGNLSVIGAEALSGYIFIRDNTGALVKIAVVS